MFFVAAMILVIEVYNYFTNTLQCRRRDEPDEPWKWCCFSRGAGREFVQKLVRLLLYGKSESK